MAKQRFINTRFWSDSFIVPLMPIERYLFLYFLTNEHTSICGIYELPLQTIAYETKVREKELLKILDRLSGKIYYLDGWIFIRNFERHQFARGNSKVRIGIENEKKSIPKEILARIKKIALVKIKIDTPSIGHARDIEGVSTLEPDSETDIDSDTDSDFERSASAFTPSQTATTFFHDPKEQETLALKIAEAKSVPVEPIRSEIRKFVGYWTERNRSGTKQRWELQRTFEVYRRMATWLEKVDRFDPVKQRRGATIV